MRVLIEFGNKRTDIKMPISMRNKIEETPQGLMELIGEALSTHKVDDKRKKREFDEIAKQFKVGRAHK